MRTRNVVIAQCGKALEILWHTLCIRMFASVKLFINSVIVGTGLRKNKINTTCTSLFQCTTHNI